MKRNYFYTVFIHFLCVFSCMAQTPIQIFSASDTSFYFDGIQTVPSQNVVHEHEENAPLNDTAFPHEQKFSFYSTIEQKQGEYFTFKRNKNFCKRKFVGLGFFVGGTINVATGIALLQYVENKNGYDEWGNALGQIFGGGAILVGGASIIGGTIATITGSVGCSKIKSRRLQVGTRGAAIAIKYKL